eukprot:TRINITY_DN18025_c0_g1_i1.p1 TRINITY_DN18025_c0_g1~~TRINITY_DN18025_c0_g1_i1.p1  ORF type:complete len:296 (+),score=41.54 TRINITY_DN18025_c0_g1_i1:173-1060(+)
MPGIAASKTLVRVDCDDLEWLPPVLPDWRFYTEELICLSTSWEGAASILGVFAVSRRLQLDAGGNPAEIPPSFVFPTGLEEICVDHAMGLEDLSTALQAPSLVVPECNCVPQITPIVESLRLKECNLNRPIIMPVGLQLRTVTVTVCRVLDGRHLNHLFARLPATLRELVVVDVVDPSDYGRYDLQTQDMHVTTFSMPIADGPLPAGLRTLVIGLPEFNQPLGPLPDALEVLDLSRSPVFNQPLGPLSPSLLELRLGTGYQQELGPLPAPLETLHVPGTYRTPLRVGTRLAVTIT